MTDVDTLLTSFGGNMGLLMLPAFCLEFEMPEYA